MTELLNTSARAVLKLVETEVEGRRPLENLVIAQKVLGAGVVGAPEGSRKKIRGGKSGGGDEPLPNGKLRFAAIIGNGIVMGMTPAETLACSPFEYLAALDGFIEANDPEGDKKLSESEKDELWTWIEGNS